MEKVIRLRTRSGQNANVSEEEIAAFGENLGMLTELIRHGDPDYDEARSVWNGMIDKYPAMIVRVTGVADVIKALNFAQKHNLLISVRGGGHNVAGSAIVDDGLVIDLTNLKGIRVDLATGTVHAQGGVTIGELDRETQAFGMAVPLGVVTETGIAGLTLSGGAGWMRRKYGMTLDNLVSADVVTADGRLVHASDDENSDLFWGIRGGGGNFGIVVSFEYKMYPVGPQVFMSAVFHAGVNAREALERFREHSANAPDELSLLAVLGRFPEDEAFPEAHHNKQFVAFVGAYVGDPEEGEKLMEPLRTFAEPAVDFSGVMPYLEAQKFFDEDYPAGEMRYYWKSSFINGLSDEVIDELIVAAEAAPAGHSTIDVWHLGGAISRVAPGETAYNTRYAPFMIGVEGNWHNPVDDEINIEWTRVLVEQIQRYSDGSQYFNFPGLYEEGDNALKDSFGENYQRLVDLKNRYDPLNLFRLNANIRPTV